MFNFFRKLFKIKEKRNYAIHDAFIATSGQPIWNNWDIKKGIDEGFLINGAVYRATLINSLAVGSVHLQVYAPDGSLAPPDHSINKLLSKPNPLFSKFELLQLMTMWLLLGGNAYLFKNKVGGTTTELLPVFPSRIKPIISKDPLNYDISYEIDDKKDDRFDLETVIHFNLIDPSNPFLGVGPLQVAAKSIDTDTSIQDWNNATFQNGGAPSGFFSFKQNLTQEQIEIAEHRLAERISGIGNARKFAVLGSDAQYTRTGSNPLEMDYAGARKFSRDEILMIFGVPGQLIVEQGFSTYNNFTTSNRIHWESTILPILGKIVDKFNLSLEDELGDYRIGVDLSKIQALRNTQKEQAETIKIWWDMGSPLSQLNEIFEMGLKEFPGWDLPFSGQKQLASQSEQKTEKKETSANLKCLERRALNVDDFAREIKKILGKQEDSVLKAVENDEDLQYALNEHEQEITDLLYTTIWDIALKSAQENIKLRTSQKTSLESRVTNPATEIENGLNKYINDESIALIITAHLQQTTAASVMQQVRQAVNEGWSMNRLAQAMQDSGIFSDVRALRIARTETAGAQSTGQQVSGELTGAQYKVWRAAGDKVTRLWHKARSGTSVGINEAWHGRSKIRFPGDPLATPMERVNCRCAIDFL